MYQPLHTTAVWMPTDCALGVDVRDVCGDTGGADNIVKGELADARVELQEERERLPDPTAGTEHCDFGGLYIILG